MTELTEVEVLEWAILGMEHYIAILRDYGMNTDIQEAKLVIAKSRLQRQQTFVSDPEWNDEVL